MKTKLSDNGTILNALLTCPMCGKSQEVEMLQNACVTFHTCEHCGEKIKAKDGECCVFCSYADVPCPDAQLGLKSCCYHE